MAVPESPVLVKRRVVRSRGEFIPLFQDDGQRKSDGLFLTTCSDHCESYFTPSQTQLRRVLLAKSLVSSHLGILICRAFSLLCGGLSVLRVVGP